MSTVVPAHTACWLSFAVHAAALISSWQLMHPDTSVVRSLSNSVSMAESTTVVLLYADLSHHPAHGNWQPMHPHSSTMRSCNLSNTVSLAELTTAILALHCLCDTELQC